MKKVDLKSITENNSSPKISMDHDLFARLDELERQERVNNEIENVASEKRNISITQEVSATISEKTSKTVKWKESIAEEKEIETVAVPKVEKATIKFTHSSGKVSDNK